MRTPFRVSLVAACGVFLAALLAALLHHNTINGRVLTPLEQLPDAIFIAILFSGLGLLGTWLGMRRGKIEYLTYRAGLAVALLYIAASCLGNATIYTAPQTVTFPSHEANIQGLEVLLIGTLWGIGAPYTIALVVSRFKLFAKSNVA
jgi:hypothetical protein